MENYIKRENLIMMGIAVIVLALNLLGFIVAYFIWKEYREESDFIDRNGYRLLNFHISFTIYTILASISVILLVGLVIAPILGLVYFILSIIGVFKYGNNKDFDYPMTINFIKY